MNATDVQMGKRILITGGAGFIGSNLTKRLLELGCEVKILDDLSSGCFDNLPKDPGLKFFKGDVRNLATVRKLTKKSDLVFHLAEFIPNTQQIGPGHVVKFSMQNPYKDLDICVKGTLNVLEAAREAGAKVVFTSSAAIYGEPLESPAKETTFPNPVSHYGVSKLAAEMYCKVSGEAFNLPAVIVRLFNVYGPKQRKYVMYDILRRLEENPNDLTVLGSGDQKRDFVYVRDAVDGLIFLSSREEAFGQVFNLGTGIPTSIERLITSMTRILGVEPSVKYAQSSWKGDIRTLVADATKLRNAGFTPKYSLVKGLKEFIVWYRQTCSGHGNHSGTTQS